MIPDTFYDSERIMFTRHPVSRIASGWLQMQPKKKEFEFYNFIKKDF